jgi:hypothetical protein
MAGFWVTAEAAGHWLHLMRLAQHFWLFFESAGTEL